MPCAASFGGKPAVDVSSCGKELRHQGQKDLGLNSGPDSFFLCVTFSLLQCLFFF